MNIATILHDKGLVVLPEYVKDSIEYLAQVGSVSYGVSTDMSDVDICGFCTARKNMLFPHEVGYIVGFGQQPDKFEQFQKHHIYDEDVKREYDLTIYNIVKFFQLTMTCNPNMIDSLFVPQRCVMSCSTIGHIVRENRKLFLSKLAYHRFKGYAHAQLSKMKEKHIWAKRLFEFETIHNLTSEFEVKNHRDLINVISLWAKLTHGDNIVFIDNSKTRHFATYNGLMENIKALTDISYIGDAIKQWFHENEGRRVSFEDDAEQFSYVDVHSISYETHHELTKKQKLKYRVEPIELTDREKEVLHAVYDKIDQKIIKLLSADKHNLYEYCNILVQFGHYSTKRMENVRKFGIDVKFGYHLVRLIMEIEQIMTEGDLVLDRSDKREILKAIRRGEWSLERLEKFFEDSERDLFTIYRATNVIPHTSREAEIKDLLINCLETRFGDLSKVIGNSRSTDVLIDKIERILYDYKSTNEIIS